MIYYIIHFHIWETGAYIFQYTAICAWTIFTYSCAKRNTQFIFLLWVNTWVDIFRNLILLYAYVHISCNKICVMVYNNIYWKHIKIFGFLVLLKSYNISQFSISGKCLYSLYIIQYLVKYQQYIILYIFNLKTLSNLIYFHCIMDIIYWPILEILWINLLVSVGIFIGVGY